MTTQKTNIDVYLRLRDQMTQGLKKTGATVKGMGETFRRSSFLMGGAITNLGGQISSVGQKLTTGLTIPLAAAALAMSQMGGAAKKLQTEAAFEKHAERLGMSTDDLLAALRDASAGTISDADLMSGAVKGMVLGVADEIDTFEILMGIARTAAKDMGLDTTDAWDRLVEGIGKAEPELLDELGLVIKLGEAFSDYAESIGKSPSELTAAEQKAAILNAVLEKSKEFVDKVALAHKTQAEEIQAATAQMKNMTDKLMVDLLPVIAKVLDKFNQMPNALKLTMVGLIGVGLVIGPVSSVIGVLMSAVGGLITIIAGFSVAGMISALQTLALFMMTNPVFVAIAAIGIAIGLLALAWSTNFLGIRDKTKVALDWIGEKFQWLKDLVGPIFSGIFNLYKSNIGWLLPGGALIKAISFLATHWNTIWNGIKAVFSSVGGGIVNLYKSNWGWLLPGGALIKAISFIATHWDAIWNGIKNGVSAIWGSIEGTVKTGINVVITLFNLFIGGINKLLGAINAISGAFARVVPGAGEAFNIGEIPTIPKLAAGGIVRRPTLAMIGERGPEMVMPLRPGMAGAGAANIIINLPSSSLLVLDNETSMRRLTDAITKNIRDVLRSQRGF